MKLFADEYWISSFSAWRNRIVLHILFWLVYLSFLCYTTYQHLALGYHLANPVLLLMLMCPVYLVIVYYIGIYTSYTSFKNRKFTKAAIAVFFTFILYLHADLLYTYMLYIRLKAEQIPAKIIEDKAFNSFYVRNITSIATVIHAVFSMVLYLFIPVSCKFIRDSQRVSKKLKELKERNLRLELNLIKSQVNPHFLLNTLNNIYGLTINGTRQQIGSMIMNLSDFLKYSLYELNADYVSIKKEVGLIKNYIELESVRSEYIQTSVEIEIDADVEIPPFLLFPLVENAFKHGTFNLVRPTNIIARLQVADNELYFRVENDIMPGNDKMGGIGLPALQKKIEYYYPGTSSLTASVNNERYIAELKISNLCCS